MRHLLVVSYVAAVANAHTFMISPAPREAAVHTNGDLNSECGASGAISATYTRGQDVPMSWGRNNHHGGFVQLSVLESNKVIGTAGNAVAQFDDPQNIIFTSCYNSICKAPNGDKFGLGGDGTEFQELLCSTSFNVPTYLADGDYTLKFSVFGNGDSFGVRNMPHSSYTNCHNFRIQGGATQTQKAANKAHIQFKLQDSGIVIANQNGVTIPQGQCMFSGTNTHLGCLQTGANRSPSCVGDIADVSRCGGGTADTLEQCYRASSTDATERQDGDLYNYMVGLPASHPEYTGKLTLLSHIRDPVPIQLKVLGGTATSAPSVGDGPEATQAPTIPSNTPVATAAPSTTLRVNDATTNSSTGAAAAAGAAATVTVMGVLMVGYRAIKK